MPSILVIHPGDAFSTADVYDGLCYGLRANGITVHEARLDQGLEAFDLFVNVAHHYLQHMPWTHDAFALAAPRVISQAAWLQPDAVIAVTGMKLHPSVPLTIRQMGIPIALLCTESPYDPKERHLAAYYDHVFTHERAAVPLFGGHPSVHYLPHAYNPERHTPGDKDSSKECDLFFVGTAFPERRVLLDAVDWTGIDKHILGAMWQFPDGTNPSDVDNAFAGVTANTEVVEWYRSSRINLAHHRTSQDWGTGLHIEHGFALDLGPRSYEIAACGGFQICDDTRDVAGVFGGSVPTYNDSASLERLIRHYLALPDERERLAREQHEVVQPHHWGNRAAEMLEVIMEGVTA